MAEFKKGIHWYHIDGYGIIGIGLRHDGNREIFSDNEELILRIVKSVTLSS